MFTAHRLIERMRSFQVVISRGEKNKAGKHKHPQVVGPQQQPLKPQSQPAQSPQSGKTVEASPVKKSGVIPKAEDVANMAREGVNEGANKVIKIPFWERSHLAATISHYLIGAVAFGIVVYSSSEIATYVLLTIFPWTLKLAEVKSKLSDKQYVKRPEIEEVVEEAISTKTPKHYYIMYGAKGVGKSTLVEKVAEGKQAVIKIKITSVDKIDRITALIMKKVTGLSQSLDQDTLVDALGKFSKSSGVVPTIIFDVERGSESDKEGTTHKGVIQDVISLAKEIFSACHCIIVISEANSVFQFGKDNRERFIYVGEMTFEQTRSFLQLQGATFSDKDVKTIYDSLGGNMTVLVELISDMKSAPLDKCIEGIVGNALCDLGAFQVKPILAALKEHPEGVTPMHFKNQKYDGIDMTCPQKVANSMKEMNAILYRIDLKPRVYQMISMRHKTALKMYEPFIDKSVLVDPKK
jgi:hypothetical protein